MPVSLDLVREQVFFRRELQERVFWLIRLRWAVGAAAVAACCLGRLLGIALPLLPLAALGLCVLLYNGCFFLGSRRLSPLRPKDLRHCVTLAHLQISCDLAALAFAIGLTGGAGSPLLILVILHVVLAGVLLPRPAAFFYGFGMVVAVGAIAAFQGTAGAVPLPDGAGGQALPLGGPNRVPVRFLLFAAVVFFSAYTITSVKVSLQTKARELLKTSRELDDTNTKLTSLYGMVKEMGAITSLKNLMDTATRQAAAIMGVKACSIKLLDDQKKYLEFSSTYGLSEDYLSMGRLELEKSPINHRIIEGSPWVIGSIDERDHFQYPENIEKEGIASMLCLPLMGNNRVLGVFCVYGREYFRFGQEDLDFFTLMSDLTGIAVERARWDLTKSWFMAKVTHNLRSPLNGILSMVSLMRKGYLGPVNEKQVETLVRCESRILALAQLVGDLLKLGRERTEMGKTELTPVAPESVLQPLVPIFEDQASHKGVEITFEITGRVPEVRAGGGLLDDLFTNLISNAIKYTPPGGRVRVELGADDPAGMRFEVSDTGIGIPEEDIPKLFSEFFRAENAKKLAEEGTGLGLVIVKEILDRLEGKIQVSSTEGQGTRFTCRIPGCGPA